jgi:hypothetical protein
MKSLSMNRSLNHTNTESLVRTQINFMYIMYVNTVNIIVDINIIMYIVFTHKRLY